MEIFVWGVWLKWAFLVLLLVLLVWVVIAVKRATVVRSEGSYKKFSRWLFPKKRA